MKNECVDCRFFNESGGGAGDVIFRKGECRKRSPNMQVVEPSYDLRKYIPVFPIVMGNDWCGEFKRRSHCV